MDTVTGYFTALGLSTAAGLNAYIPLLVVGLSSRYTDLIDLPAPWDHLGDPLVLGLVAVVGIADFVGDKIPVVDHVLHVLGMVVAPVVGGILALAAANALESSPDSPSCWVSSLRSRPRSAGAPRVRPPRRPRPEPATPW